MDTEGLKKELAEKVMKWEYKEGQECWITKEKKEMNEKWWNPERDLNDAFDLTYEFDEFLIRKRAVGLQYRTWGIIRGKEYISHGTNPNQAVINLVRRAYNLKK